MSSLLSPARVEGVFWALLCGGLAIGIGMETDWGVRWQNPPGRLEADPAAFAMPPLAEPYRLPPADEFLETAMRPIFVTTRRPSPPPPPPEAPKPTMKRGQFQLKGITIVGTGKFAFVLEKAGNKSLVLTEGKEVNGIKVREIAPDRVVLSQFDDTEVLFLQTTKGPLSPPPAPMTSPPPQGNVLPPGFFPSGNHAIGPPPILPSNHK